MLSRIHSRNIPGEVSGRASGLVRSGNGVGSPDRKPETGAGNAVGNWKSGSEKQKGKWKRKRGTKEQRTHECLTGQAAGLSLSERRPQPRATGERGGVVTWWTARPSESIKHETQ